MSMLFLLCHKRQLNAIVDEMQDWKTEGATIFLYGITNKASYGFVILEWSTPVPESFHEKLRRDHDIIDYLVIGKPLSPIAQQPA